EYTSIAIGFDGLPIISYYDATAHTLKVAHCNDTVCAGNNRNPTTVAGPGNHVGQFSPIAIGTDNLAIISYDDETAHSLKVAHCDNTLCTTKTITTVDDPADIAGRYTSIHIGHDTLPVYHY